jgi:hypothetical protein
MPRRLARLEGALLTAKRQIVSIALQPDWLFWKLVMHANIALRARAASLVSNYNLAHAEIKTGKCAGVLHRSQEGLNFGGRRGEGICIINKIEEKKFTAVCSVNQYCRVTGLVDSFKELGEYV